MDVANITYTICLWTVFKTFSSILAVTIFFFTRTKIDRSGWSKMKTHSDIDMLKWDQNNTVL